MAGFSAVNFHFWAPCNMACGYCFATFDDVRLDLPKGHLSVPDVLAVIDALADAGFVKINFVGGEPTTCPWLEQLITHAWATGMTVSMVTNGSRIDRARLDRMAGKLAWLGLSLDSLNTQTNRQIGRVLKGVPMSSEDYAHLCANVHAVGMRLKLNTVVNAFNQDELLADFVNSAKPERWKIFQALPVQGQNDASFESFKVQQHAFDAFVERQRVHLARPAILVDKDNEAMRNSYAMVDPMGRFFNNALGAHFYSAPILNVGVALAFAQVQPSFKKFVARHGVYAWGAEKSALSV